MKGLKMWDWLKSAGGFFKNNSDLLSGLGTIASGVGNAYSAYSANKLAKKTYDLNADILREEQKRRRQQQENLDRGWANSTMA